MQIAKPCFLIHPVMLLIVGLVIIAQNVCRDYLYLAAARRRVLATHQIQIRQIFLCHEQENVWVLMQIKDRLQIMSILNIVVRGQAWILMAYSLVRQTGQNHRYSVQILILPFKILVITCPPISKIMAHFLMNVLSIYMQVVMLEIPIMAII